MSYLRSSSEASGAGDDAGVLRGSDAPHAIATVILNADDWGLNAMASERILECVRAGVLSSVSAMVFMDVSESSAEVAHGQGMDAGLHLNLTTAFTGTGASAALSEHHRRVIEYLRGPKFHRVVFNPLLSNSFAYAVQAQVEEFARIYGHAPRHVDGHHHMHLCANVLLGGLLPAGAMVRGVKSQLPGEPSKKPMLRRAQMALLRRRHSSTDFFFDLCTDDCARLKGMVELARTHDVEISAHPAHPEDYRFLMSGELFRCAEDVVIAERYELRGGRSQQPQANHSSRAGRTAGRDRS